MSLHHRHDTTRLEFQQVMSLACEERYKEHRDDAKSRGSRKYGTHVAEFATPFVCKSPGSGHRFCSAEFKSSLFFSRWRPEAAGTGRALRALSPVL